MEIKFQKQLRALKLYNACLTILVLGMLFFSFSNKDKKVRYNELTVERLNVVNKQGKYVLIIGNRDNLPGSTMNGVEFSQQKRGSGFIFYNEDGDECGGYQWGSSTDGSAGAVFAIDQYKQDQIVSLIYQEGSGPLGSPDKKRLAGLSINPQPTGIALDELLGKYQEARAIQDSLKRSEALAILNKFYTSTSMFAGKRRNDDMGVFISDANQNARLKIYTDKNGNPKLEFLDSLGNLIYALPPKK